MKGWLLVAPDGHAEDDLRRWVDRGVAYASSLPPKWLGPCLRRRSGTLHVAGQPPV
jgi:hypothetical protein